MSVGSQHRIRPRPPRPEGSRPWYKRPAVWGLVIPGALLLILVIWLVLVTGAPSEGPATDTATDPAGQDEPLEEGTGVVTGPVGGLIFDQGSGAFVAEEVSVQLDDGRTVTAQVDIPGQRGLGLDQLGSVTVRVEDRGSGWFVTRVLPEGG